MSWSKIKIANLGRVVTGKTPPTKQRQYFNGEYPFITPSDLEYDSFRVVDTETTVSDEAKSKFANQFIPENAVTFTCIASVGKIGVTTVDSLTNQQINSIIVNEQHDWRFVYYMLRNEAPRIRGMCSGVATPIINKSAFEKVKVIIPDELSTEQTIASVLSAYDDLIENNRRRIELLEQAARLLYKEWFVHLRFPGHEHVKIVDGMPEGWTVRSLSDLATKVGSGATPRGGAAAYQSEGISLIRSMNIYDYQFEDEGLAHINDNQAQKLSAVTVEPLDILLNITGASVARCCMVPERHLPARVNQHVMIIRIDSNECGSHYVLNFINSHQQKQKLLSIAKAGGSTREALTKDVVQNISISVPTVHLLDQFEETAGRLFDQCQLFAAHNSQLSKARDLLLPRLMNGEVVV